MLQQCILSLRKHARSSSFSSSSLSRENSNAREDEFDSHSEVMGESNPKSELENHPIQSGSLTIAAQDCEKDRTEDTQEQKKEPSDRQKQELTASHESEQKDLFQ